MPPLQADTKEQQIALAHYCRTGEFVALNGITENRVHHYRRLVFNVVKDALSSTYPLTSNLLTPKEWSILCQEFFADHSCSHPQVWRMPQELIAYAERQQTDLVDRYPQVLDLLRLEWLEAEFYMMPDRSFSDAVTENIFRDAWNLNPESQLVAFSYPVHLKNASFISRTDAGQFFCLIFRHPDTFKVRFINLSPMLALVINAMKDDPHVSLDSLFPLINHEFGIGDLSVLRDQFYSFSERLKADGMLR